MDRGERRRRDRVVKIRRLRMYYEYWGLPRPWLFNGESRLLGARWLEHPWRVDGAWFFSTPGAWVREMMTRPARAAQARALRRVELGVDPDVATPRWPDYRRPHVYYW